MKAPIHSPSRVILGSVQLGLNYGINNQSGQPSEAEAFAILGRAKALGINKIDTADGYGTSQALIGRYQREKGGFDVYTKFTFTPKMPSISACLEHTLEELKADQIACYSFHRFQDFSQYKNTGELGKLQDKVRWLGVSVYSNDELEQAISTDFITVIQLPLNLLDQSSKKRDLLKKAKQKGKILHTRSVYLQGLFFKESTTFPAQLRSLLPYMDQLKIIAEESRLALGELALLYPLSIAEIDAVLIGVETVAQLDEGMRVLKKTPLSQETINEIQKIDVRETELLSPANWSKG